jgi:hypothetical protein
MKTKRDSIKKFDAVEFMRKKRDEIATEIKGMTPEQEIEYFKRKATQLKKT